MIVLTAPIQQEKIIKLLEAYSEEGLAYTFKEKQGIKLFFETTAEDLDAAAQKAKTIIKSEPWGSVLYFQAQAVK